MIKKKIRNITLLLILIAGAVFFIIKPVWVWLKYDVKAIDAGYKSTEDDISFFTYGGKTYYEIAYMESIPIPYDDLEKECIGRAKGTSVVLYLLKNDPENSIIVGENPLNDMLIYSCKYKELPEDGEVTGVYLHLSFENKYISDGMELFQRLWTERYKNGATKLDEDTINKPVRLLCMFCFDGCPLPSNTVQNRLAYQNGKWYLVEYQNYVVNHEPRSGYFGYPIDDIEIIEYLNEYIKKNAKGEVNLEAMEAQQVGKIPEDLQTILKESFLAGTAAETLQSMIVDKVVETVHLDWGRKRMSGSNPL